MEGTSIDDIQDRAPEEQMITTYEQLFDKVGTLTSRPDRFHERIRLQIWHDKSVPAVLICLKKPLQKQDGQLIILKTFTQGADHHTKFYKGADYPHEGVLWEIKDIRNYVKEYNSSLEVWTGVQSGWSLMMERDDWRCDELDRWRSECDIIIVASYNGDKDSFAPVMSR